MLVLFLLPHTWDWMDILEGLHLFPISEGQFQPDEIREGYEQVAKTIFGAKIHDPTRTEESTERTSGDH